MNREIWEERAKYLFEGTNQNFVFYFFIFTYYFYEGGKKGSRWRDDVWTMKYLPRFRWDMLSEQVGTYFLSLLSPLPAQTNFPFSSKNKKTALERATQTSLLRFHLQHSRTEQESYLSAVEKNRVKTAIETKAEGRREGKRLKGESTSTGAGGVVEAAGGEKKVKKERERSYRQREVLDVGEKGERKVGSKAELDSVLGRLF